MRRGARVRRTVVLGLVLGVTVGAIIITLSVLYAQHDAPDEPWDQYRLPHSLKPRKYNITLWPRLTKNEHGLYIFTGHSTVDFECVKETDLILIHSNKLNLTKSGEHHAVLTGLGGAVAPTIKTTWLQVTTEYLVIQLNSKLEAGKYYQLYTSFTGELADDLGGFYRSQYYEETGLKVLATTQMEPTDARKAFPCFDEPALKAVFHLSLIHNRNTVALSNSMEIDHVAVTQMAAEAMENWGLVTYMERALLFTQTAIGQHFVVEVIAHELGHMWFGNLVTMKWWNDVWLNEAFATYVSHLGAAMAEPDDELRDTMLWTEIKTVFEVDAKANSYPLAYPEEEINTPTEIRQLFNSITYNKGACVLKMLSEFLTEPVFSKGLSNYLHASAYKNTMTTDLWKHLQAEVDRSPTLKLPGTIQEIMNPWVLQMGFPIITINTTTGTISQKHFLTDTESVVERPSIYNYEWFVPITWKRNGTIQERKWLLSKSDVHEPMKTSEWILANLNVDGFYRVNYDEGNWGRLIAELQSDHKAIPVLNRAQIIDDAFHLAQANITDIVLALKTTQYLTKETVFAPWESALDGLQHLIHMPPHIHVATQKYLKKQVEPFFMHIKNSVVSGTKYLADVQVETFDVACKVGLEGCTDLARGWFQEWMKNPLHNTIPYMLQSIVYCHGIATGGQKEWDLVWDRMYSTSEDQRKPLASALSCTRDPGLLNRTLQNLLDPSMGYSLAQHIGQIADLEHFQPLLWDHLRANMMAIFNEENDYSDMIRHVTKRFYTELELKQLLDFEAALQAAGLSSVAKAVHEAAKRTKAQVKWMDENQEKMIQWLTSAAR